MTPRMAHHIEMMQSRIPLQTPDLTKLSLPWTFDPKTNGWEVKVPVHVAMRKGEWHIWFQQRAYYCDRGRYHCQVDGISVEGPDFQEGFPRYYFSLQRGMEEMEEWVKIRSEVVQKEATA